MPLFDKLLAGLEAADLTADELRELQALAPKLSKVIEAALINRNKKIKDCTVQEKQAIVDFIDRIGYEVTPAQPDEAQLESLKAVPKCIEKKLFTLMPFAHMPLLACLNEHAIPNQNLDDILRWLISLNALFTKLAKAKPNSLQEHFFRQVFTFTDKVGLDFADTAMAIIQKSQLTLHDMKSFFEELVPIKESLENKRDPYLSCPSFYDANAIKALLERKDSTFLPLLERTLSGSQCSQEEALAPSFSPRPPRRQAASQ